FALWDRQTGTLFCARDAFGIKPLYYYQAADGTLLFASEVIYEESTPPERNPATSTSAILWAATLSCMILSMT
ncbi:hypothetical protein H6B10_17800, partial [Gemmiger formicilis]|nr:hypothetical protein [Gemmiger formicilis]